MERDTEMEFALSFSSSSSVLGIKHKQHRTISPIPYHTHSSSHKYSPTNGTSSLCLCLNTTMLSNGYVGRDINNSSSFKIPNNNSSSSSKIYRRQDSCLVIAPPNGKTPRAIIKFLGGAFIGAVPEVTYR